MRTLNDIPGDESQADDAEWTPEIGERRAVIRGLLAAGLLALLLAPLTLVAPALVFPWHMRTVIAFGVAWVLFSVVQRAAGMVSVKINGLAIGLTLLVLLSTHVVFAIFGTPDASGNNSILTFPLQLADRYATINNGRAIGWGWCNPELVVIANAVPLLGIGLAAVFKWHGD